MTKNILAVTGLHTHFFTPSGVAKVVNGVSFTVNEGEVVGLVGESGTGKSVIAQSIINLVRRPGRIVRGEVRFQGENLLTKTQKELQQIRGKQIGMIVPHPGGFLNPVSTAGDHIADMVRVHQGIGRSEARRRAIEMLTAVGINDPERRSKAYPHELSGGMQQRIIIGMALVNSPELIIADGPVTGLDVTIQAQVLELMAQLLKDYGAAMLLIERNLGIIAQHCQRVGVLYSGQIVEYTTVEELFREPLHPYSQYLLASVRPGSKATGIKWGRMPSPLSLPSGCTFHPRCPLAEEQCRVDSPKFVEVRAEHWVQCYVVERNFPNVLPSVVAGSVGVHASPAATSEPD